MGFKSTCDVHGCKVEVDGYPPASWRAVSATVSVKVPTDMVPAGFPGPVPGTMLQQHVFNVCENHDLPTMKPPQDESPSVYRIPPISGPYGIAPPPRRF